MVEEGEMGKAKDINEYTQLYGDKPEKTYVSFYFYHLTGNRKVIAHQSPINVHMDKLCIE